MFRFTGAEGNVIAADIIGNSSHQPVILMHGGGQTRHAWRDAAVILAERGFFVISVDMRGHGSSDWVRSGNYSITAAAADIHCILAGLTRPPLLVGASYGGLTALYLAGTSPHAVKAMVLVDVVPKINPEGVAPIRAFMASNQGGFASLEEAAACIADYLPQRQRRSNPEGLRKNLRLREDGRYYWHWDPAFMDSTGTEQIYSELTVLAQDITAPTLLVHGGLSAVVDAEGISHLRELIRHVEYVKVDDAGHMVAGDKNNAFQAAVVAFLEKFR